MKWPMPSWLRDPSPILVKELQATFRRPLFVRFLYLTTGLVALIILGIGATIASGGTPPAEVGRTVFRLFFLMSASTIVLVAPGFGATLISSERQGGTWESLLLSNIDPWRIVRGKLLAGTASLGLVLVAIGPVAGIAFLFGGVTPTEVAMGFLGVGCQLVFALAYGLAIGAHMPSMRVAIAVSTVTYGPIALFQLMLVAIVSSVVSRRWYDFDDGPLFWTRLLSEHGDDPVAWLYVVGIPAYVLVMFVWFFLAGSVAGVRPRSQDRSTPLKQWAVVMSATTIVAGGIVIAMMGSAREQRDAMIFGGIAIGMLLVVYAFIFVNDSDLPPRRFTRRLASGSRWRRLFAPIGPGAAGTLRFGYLLVIGTVVAAALAFYLNGHLERPFSDGYRHDGAMGVFLGGGALTSLLLMSSGARLGLWIPRGIAIRAIQLLILFGGMLVPFLFAVVLDPNMGSRARDDPSPALHLSLMFPYFVARAMTGYSGTNSMLLRWAIGHSPYVVATFAFTVWVEIETRRRARRRATLRASLDESVRRASMPAPEPSPPTSAEPVPAVASRPPSAAQDTEQE